MDDYQITTTLTVEVTVGEKAGHLREIRFTRQVDASTLEEAVAKCTTMLQGTAILALRNFNGERGMERLMSQVGTDEGVSFQWLFAHRMRVELTAVCGVMPEESKTKLKMLAPGIPEELHELLEPTQYV